MTVNTVPAELKAPAMDVVFSMPSLNVDDKVSMLGQMTKRYFGQEYNQEVLRAAVQEALRTY